MLEKNKNNNQRHQNQKKDNQRPTRYQDPDKNNQYDIDRSKQREYDTSFN